MLRQRQVAVLMSDRNDDGNCLGVCSVTCDDADVVFLDRLVSATAAGCSDNPKRTRCKQNRSEQPLCH